MILQRAFPMLLSSICLTLVMGCGTFKSALYDQHSYQKAVEIKVDAARLMDKASEPYSNHTQHAEEVLAELDKMVIYEANKPNNSISLRMWKILADSDKNLLAGFIKKWEADGTLNPILVSEAQSQVAEAFDLLIQYEGKKEKATEDSLITLILKKE
ncbi:MAG: hypothetical protein AAGF77_04145 [Bacteroidota bacterium]